MQGPHSSPSSFCGLLYERLVPPASCYENPGAGGRKMSSGEVRMPRRVRRGWRILGWTLLGLVAALVALWVAAHWAAGRKLAATLADLRARGELLTFAELIPPGISDDQNAAVLYLSVFAPTPPPVAGAQAAEVSATSVAGLSYDQEGLLGKYVAHPTPEGDREMAVLLARPQVQRMLNLLRQGSDRPYCVLPGEWENPSPNPVQHLFRFPTCVRLAAAQAVLAGRSGDSAAAASWLAVGLRMARHLGQTPTLLSLLIEHHLISILFRVAPEALGTQPPWSTEVQELGRALAALDLRGDSLRAIRGDRALAHAIFSQSIEARTRSPRDAIILRLQRPLLRWDEVACLSFVDQVIAAAQADQAPPDSEQYLAQLPPRWVPDFLKAPLAGSMARLLTRILPRTRAGQARIVVWQAALAVHRWRNAHGSYPDTLAQVAAEEAVPLDPFSGQALIYRREGQGFVLYSVGPNQQDDGGVPKTVGPARRSPAGDIVWRVD